MQDIYTRVCALHRPKLLVQAARFGQDDYARTNCLRRLLKCDITPGPAQAIVRLLDIEAGLDERRAAGTGDYSIAHHVEALIALMAEARLLRDTRAKPQLVTE